MSSSESEQTTVAVGIGKIHATKDTSKVLASCGLGSCVAVSMYDPMARVGGLAHVMLPSSKETGRRVASYRFADVAVPALIKELIKLGATPRRLVCKIAGGAQMLAAPGQHNSLSIGERNVEAVREALIEFGIVPDSADTGGTQGRTMRLFVDTGRVVVRTAGGEDVEI